MSQPVPQPQSSASMPPTPKPVPVPRNGVDVPKLFATLDVVKGQPQIAQFQFRASNRWVKGTHSRSTIAGYWGAMQEMTHGAAFTLDLPATVPEERP